MTSREERFWAKVDFNGPGGCWPWTGSVSPGGYGHFAGGRKGASPLQAHRFAYELLVGPIPAGLHIDHLCRVRSCVNPAHLEPVTNRENALRGNSFSAVNAAKTHCVHGHSYDETNTWVSKTGRRDCRTCQRDRRSARAAEKEPAS